MFNLYDINLYIVLIMGLLIGSFLNVIVYRLPRGIKFTNDRSVCTSCGQIIKWYDLIPVISYLILGGKCRSCKTKISIQYPFVELITSILFGTTYLVASYFNINIYLIIFLLFIVSLIIIGCFTDFLYLGCYDFSTYFVCILFGIFILISSKDIKYTLSIITSGLSYLIPMILMAIYAYAGSKGKLLYKGFAFVFIFLIAVFASSFVEFNLESLGYIFTKTINWLLLAILLIVADYLINKLKGKNIAKECITSILTWFRFVTYFMFIFSGNTELITLNAYKTALGLNFKNAIILIIGTLAYLFFIELFNGYDNDVDAIEADDEIENTEENKFSDYIGDGDFLIMPLAGMILGYPNVLAFFCLLAINVLSIYGISFKKGIKYHIPLYPFIILSVIILYFINFFA